MGLHQSSISICLEPLLGWVHMMLAFLGPAGVSTWPLSSKMGHFVCVARFCEVWQASHPVMCSYDLNVVFSCPCLFHPLCF